MIEEAAARRLKLATLFGLVLLLAAVVTINVVPPASGYEISIYDAYPVVFWVFVGGAVLVGNLVIVGSARRPEDRSWVGGLALVLLTNAVLLLMPHIRGYPMYGRDDAMTHVGFIRDEATQGALSGGNIYPDFHLVTQTLSSTTGLDLLSSISLLPAVYSLVFFGGLLLLVTQVFESRERVLLTLPFVTLPLFGKAHLNPRPFDMALMLIPLVLYLLVKGQRRPSPAVNALFVVGVFGFVTYHPLMPLFVAPLLIVWYVAERLPWFGKSTRPPVTVVLLPLAIAVAWYQNFLGIIFRFRRLYNILVGITESESQLENYTETVSETSPAFVDVATKAAVELGLEGVLFGLGFVAVVVHLGRRFSGREETDSYTLVFVAMLAVFGVGGLSFLVMDLLIPPERPFQIAKLGAAILTGGLFYALWNEVERRERAGTLRSGFNALLAVTVVTLVLISTVSLYPSPIGTEDNPQVSEMELAGTDWFTESRDPDVPVTQLGLVYERFHDASEGSAAWPGYGTSQEVPPPHFNYTVYDSLGASYESDVYLLIAQGGRDVYRATFPDYREFWRQTPEDYARLERDPTTVRVYTSGDLDVYRVRGVGTEGTTLADVGAPPSTDDQGRDDER